VSDAEFWRTAAPVTAAAIALTALLWNVLSWRLDGPALRFHCLFYRHALVIRVFNAGRIADSVEQFDLGARTRLPMTRLLELPTRVEPGQSLTWQVGVDHLPQDRLAGLHGGWYSLWVLTGSMREVRAEIVPMPRDEPAASGWNLVRRREKAYRWLPFATYLLGMFATTPGRSSTSAIAAGALLAGLVGYPLLRLYGLRAARFQRRRVERCATVAIAVAGLVAHLCLRDADSMARQPTWVTWPAVLAFSVALGLALPRFGDAFVQVPSRARALAERCGDWARSRRSALRIQRRHRP
jgi:hypothetical protein